MARKKTPKFDLTRWLKDSTAQGNVPLKVEDKATLHQAAKLVASILKTV